MIPQMLNRENCRYERIYSYYIIIFIESEGIFKKMSKTLLSSVENL